MLHIIAWIDGISLWYVLDWLNMVFFHLMMMVLFEWLNEAFPTKFEKSHTSIHTKIIETILFTRVADRMEF